MLVFATAGLDSMVKQLIRDCLPQLVDKENKQVRDGLQDYVVRQLRHVGDGQDSSPGTRFLARVLVADERRKEVIDAYVDDLTGSSLQSTEELLRVSAAFGIDAKSLGITQTKLRPIFEARNKIIHELDMDLSARNRNRQSRTRAQFVKYTEDLLEVAEDFLDAVEAKLS